MTWEALESRSCDDYTILQPITCHSTH